MKKRRRGRQSARRGAKQDQFQQIQQQMQEEWAKQQAQLEDEELAVSVGGGALTVNITGHQRVRSVQINPQSLDLDDAEWLQDLQDLLVVAMNQAIEQSQALAAKRLEGIMGSPGGISLEDLLPR